MLVLVGGVVVGAVVVSALVVGASVRVVVSAGATGPVVVALLAGGGVVAVVTADGVVDDVDGDVEPPVWVRSTISKITTASRTATSAAKPITAARLRYHGVGAGAGWWR